MKTLDVYELQEILKHVAKTIVKNEPYLTEIDSRIGDGDHGIGMKRGFGAVGRKLETEEYGKIDELCATTGMELLKSMGGASGVIFCTLFFAGSGMLPSGETVDLETLACYFEAGEKAIEKRGRAKDHAGCSGPGGKRTEKSCSCRSGNRNCICTCLCKSV